MLPELPALYFRYRKLPVVPSHTETSNIIEFPSSARKSVANDLSSLLPTRPVVDELERDRKILRPLFNSYPICKFDDIRPNADMFIRNYYQDVVDPLAFFIAHYKNTDILSPRVYTMSAWLSLVLETKVIGYDKSSEKLVMAILTKNASWCTKRKWKRALPPEFGARRSSDYFANL